jgi:hypothetical protein
MMMMSTPVARPTQIKDEPPIHLVEQFLLRQIGHLPEETLDFRPWVTLQVFFREARRRGIGRSLDPHHVEVALAAGQFRAATGAEQNRFVAGGICAHAAILRLLSSSVKNLAGGRNTSGVENRALPWDDGITTLVNAK